MAAAPRNILIVNAEMITCDPGNPMASWAAVMDGKFSAVGRGEDWKNLFSNEKSTIIDCDHKIVVPGFIDAHFHIASFIKSILNLDFSPGNNVTSIEDIQNLIKKYSVSIPTNKWILGTGYNEFYLSEKRHPNKRDLDIAAPDHPVMVVHRSTHARVFNSLGLKFVGICNETGDPDGGIIDRDLQTGEPTGIVFGVVDFLADRIPSPSRSELERAAGEANRRLVSVGLTCVQDATSRNDVNQWKSFESLKETGVLQPRINMMLSYSSFLKSERPFVSGAVDPNRLRSGAVKILLTNTSGRLHPSQPELNEMVATIHGKDGQVAIHAIEEDEIEAAYKAIRRALKKKPKTGHRHRIEHCSVCPPELAKRLASQQILVVTQPSFLYYNGERYLKTVPENQFRHLYPLKTLLSHQILSAGSSDCPIVPPSPLAGIYAAVTRMDEKGNILVEQEKIPFKEALGMYTFSAAYAMFSEASLGSISCGKQADLAVLSMDSSRLMEDGLRNLQVGVTMIGGNIVWDRGGISGNNSLLDI